MARVFDQVKMEGFALLGLCADLRDFVSLGRTRRTYPTEANSLLDYIGESLDAIDRFARGVIGDTADPHIAKSKLRDLGHIKTSLSWIYTLTKSVIDADSLSIPFSLATYINHIARRLQGRERASLVVIGSSELMYYKCNLKPLRSLTRYLGDRVPSYPVLSGEIGMLMFPYCAAKDALVNCDLFHELGHYVYETTDIERQIVSHVNQAFSKFVEDQEIIEALRQPLFAVKRLINYVHELLLRWADEIFADLFAVRVVGPAFHLAYRELQQVMPVPDDAGSPEQIAVLKNQFSDTHPPDNYRFGLHYDWLKKGEWEDVFKNHLPNIWSQMESCNGIPLGKFTVASGIPLEEIKGKEDKVHAWMVCEFDKLVQIIGERVDQETRGLPRPVEDFDKSESEVFLCLKHGVVPRMVRDREKKVHPNPTTVLNCGFLFYLGGMTDLLDKMKNDLEMTEKRIWCERRLNEWLGKAIDDWRIMQVEC